MTNSKNTKRALLLSVLSMMLCFAMLAGSTFAWFTDSVKSGTNKIVAGNLDIELEYLDAEGAWKPVTAETQLFSEFEADGTTENLWEPGHTEIVYLRIRNAGSLALKYQLKINVAKDDSFTNALGEQTKLSEHLVFGKIESDTAIAKYTTREDAWAAAGNTHGLSDYIKGTELYPEGTEDQLSEQYVALVVYMPTTVGDEANYRGETAPRIELGVNLVATQAVFESDSFGADYDESAPVLSYEVTPANIQEYLDGTHGSMTNAKLILAPGNYGKLIIGTPSKYATGDTVYTCKNGTGHSNTPLTFTDAQEFQEHMSANWHYTPYYTRTISNLTLVGQEGVTVEGLSISSGHVYGDNIYDPVRDTTASGSRYFMTLNISNLTFEGINFNEKVNIQTSDAETVIDGVTFDRCSFTTNGTASSNGQGLRYCNENNNEKVKNLTVKGCSFENCYQGIYTANIVGVSVTDCTFDTTGHNAVAIQSGAHGPVNHKAVVIQGNTFTNIGDRIIRFGDVGADTQITIRNNTATNSGDTAGEVMKAQSLADGITYDIGGNNWGEGTNVPQDALKDA